MKQFKIFFGAFIFTFLFSLISFADTTSVSDTSTSISTNPSISEAERIVDKYGGKIIEGFNSLVQKATPVAKEGFKIAVKLQIAKGIGRLIPIFMFFLFLFLAFKFSKGSTWDIEGRPENDKAVLTLISGIISGVMFVIACVTTYSGILYLMAPEWFAIKDIIELLK